MDLWHPSLVIALKRQPFAIAIAIAIDGSNDNGLEKMNPLTVRLYDGQSKITTQLLDMCLTKGKLVSNSIANHLNTRYLF